MNYLDTLPNEILDYIYKYVHKLNFQQTIQIISKFATHKRQKYDDLLFIMFLKVVCLIKNFYHLIYIMIGKIENFHLKQNFTIINIFTLGQIINFFYIFFIY
jgi:hypothetical protein